MRVVVWQQMQADTLMLCMSSWIGVGGWRLMTAL